MQVQRLTQEYGLPAASHHPPVPAGSMAVPMTTGRAYLAVGKPVIDRVGALVILVLLTPLMALVALAVVVTMGGPVLYGQTRVGQHGHRFTVWKFRSMDADRRTSAGTFNGHDRRISHKSARDPRLTSTGRFLRRFSLDELPQLVNVIKGDMSLVGPRPELPEVVDRHYRAWHHRRHALKPGLTGLWQVSERGNGMMHEHLDVDLDYVDRVGFGTDVAIMLRTIPAALATHQGS